MLYEVITNYLPPFTMRRDTASAILIPSIAADMIPPAYPAPSPPGYVITSYSIHYTKLYDSETNDNLVIKTSLLKNKYREIYNAHINRFKKVFTEKKIYFTFITTRTPFHIPLREIVLVRGKK